MADETVKRIKLQIIDEFSRNLDKYERAMGQAANATDNLGKRGGLKQLNKDLGAIASKATIGAAALTGFFKGADALSQVGQSALRSRASLEALTDSTADYEQKVRAVQQATRGLTTESEAAAIAARLQQFGLAETAGEMQQFVDTIVRVGAVNPMLGDTSEAINQIQLTLSNMSFMRLDQLGLSSGKVRARMAELKAETKDLTNEAAFQQAVMEGLATQAGRVDDAMLDIGRNQGRVKTALREVRDEVGIGLNSVLEEAAGNALLLAETISALGGGETVVRLAFEVAGLSQAESTAFIRDFNRVAGDIQTAAMPGLTSGNQPSTVQSVIAPGLPFGIELPGWMAGATPTQRPQTLTGRRAGSMTSDMAQQLLDQAFGSMQWGGDPSRVVSSMNLAAWQARQGSLSDPTLRRPLDIGTFQSRQQDLAGQDRGLTPTRLPTTGAAWELMQAAERGLGWASGETDAIVSSIAGNVGVLAERLFAAGDAASEFAEQAERFTSINEMLGVAPDALDADIYNRAAEALRNADVEGEAYAEALRILGIETGVTNVANEVFNDQLDNLAQAYEAGSITAAEYVEQVRLLQTLDASMIQAFADSMDPEQAAAFAEALGAVGGIEAFDTAYTKINDILGLIRGDDEEEGAGAGVFQGMVDDSQSMAEEVIANAGDMSREAEAALTQLTSTGQRSFQDLSNVAIEEFDKINKGISSFHGVTFTFTVSAIAPGVGDTMAVGGSSAAQPGQGGPPEFAEGGFTGRGSSPFLAMLHPNEVVIPLDKLGRGGSSMPAVPQMTTAGMQSQRLEAEQPLIIMLGDDEISRATKRIAYRTNAGGMVRTNG